MRVKLPRYVTTFSYNEEGLYTETPILRPFLETITGK